MTILTPFLVFFVSIQFIMLLNTIGKKGEATDGSSQSCAHLTKALEEAKASFSRIAVVEALDGPSDVRLARCLGEARNGFTAAREALSHVKGA